jgi:hypothetical protein
LAGGGAVAKLNLVPDDFCLFCLVDGGPMLPDAVQYQRHHHDYHHHYQQQQQQQQQQANTRFTRTEETRAIKQEDFDSGGSGIMPWVERVENGRSTPETMTEEEGSQTSPSTADEDLMRLYVNDFGE